MDFQFIQGEIVPEESKTSLGFLPEGPQLNTNSSLSDENKLRVLAVGGSFVSGYTNWGYYNKGMLSSYPNLLARQVGQGDFASPLFEEVNRNGTGYKNLVSKSPLVYNEVIDYCLEFSESNKNLGKISNRPNNLAIPYLKMFDWNRMLNSSGMVPSYFYDRTFDPFLDRFFNSGEEKNSSFIENVFNRWLKEDDASFFHSGAWTTRLSIIRIKWWRAIIITAFRSL